MDQLTIVHLSDTHLTDDGRLLYGRINPWRRLAQALSAAEQLAPDVVVLTGDVADRGAEIHADAAKILAEAQYLLGCPVITIPGNHDPAGSIGSEFNTTRLSTGPYPANTVHDIDGLRIIGLDSGGFQLSQGNIDPAQLAWLDRLLSVSAPKGSLLLLHHPPLESFSPALAGRGLQNPQALAALVAGSDVRAILCGHYHQTGASQLLNVPVFMAPATSYNMNPFAPSEVIQENCSWFSVMRLSAASVVSVPASTAQMLPLHQRTENYLALRRS
ncbi:metallophosphoesterase family protein [Glutamicibacter sp. NPDC087344]|uniref:metallophosphoesterase family protein n=1 Tax=Glutamicibacter sp. NPDC087344 TaxID=3363994 RepID=UPI0037FF3D73